MSIAINKITKEDNATLAQIIRGVFIEHNAPQQGTVYSDPTTDNLSDYFNINGAIGLTATYNNQVVGCCGIYPTEGLPAHYVELVKFYLHKDARGKGIGKQLMHQCLQYAKSLNYSHVYIESLPHFNTAVNMYTQLGFKNLNQALGKSGHTTCNIWMLKEL